MDGELDSVALEVYICDTDSVVAKIVQFVVQFGKDSLVQVLRRLSLHIVVNNQNAKHESNLPGNRVARERRCVNDDSLQGPQHHA